MGLDFTQHKIAEKITNDYNRVIAGPEMKAFEKGLTFKSDRVKMVDIRIVKLMKDRMLMYKNGWIAANALQTNELLRKNELLDQMDDRNIQALTQLNKISNQLIITLQKLDMIPDEVLNELREMERIIQPILKK